MEHTSVSLLQSLRQPENQDAWDRLVKLYAPLMHRWMQAFGIQGADADDLVQDVLGVVVQEAPHFHRERPGAFRAWLRQVLVNRVRNFWRSRQHRPLATGASSVLDRLQELEDDTSQLSCIWNEQHDREVIARLVELVKPTFLPKTWDAFHRQMFGGQPADQVAEELSMSLSSVYVARSRVLAALRREADGLVDSTGLP
jgi:RNA polymerase sigma-70 factor (ECF subfamily)